MCADRIDGHLKIRLDDTEQYESDSWLSPLGNLLAFIVFRGLEAPILKRWSVELTAREQNVNLNCLYRSFALRDDDPAIQRISSTELDHCFN